MANEAVRRATNPIESGVDATQFVQIGKEQADAMLNVQKELLEAFEEAGQAWAARVKSEVELWSDLAKKLSETRSVPEGLQAYRECASRRMMMVAEDGRHLFEEGQKIVNAMNRSLVNGWSAEKTK